MLSDELVYWGTSDGQPPLDTPPCGFYGENCVVVDTQGGRFAKNVNMLVQPIRITVY